MRQRTMAAFAILCLSLAVSSAAQAGGLVWKNGTSEVNPGGAQVGLWSAVWSRLWISSNRR